MNLHYDDLTIEWLGNTAPMDSLNNPQLVAKEVESYLYQMDLEDERCNDLEEAYASPILDAKYGKVEIEEVIKDNCSHLSPDKQCQLRDMLLKHETLFGGVLKTFPGQPMPLGLFPGQHQFIGDHIMYLKYTWKLLKRSRSFGGH